MKQTAAAIEFGTSKVVVHIGEKKSDSNFEVLGSGICPYSGYRNKQWIEPGEVRQAVAQAVQEAEDQSRRRIKDIYVGVPGGFSKLIQSDGNILIQNREQKVTREDIRNVLDEALFRIQYSDNEIIHHYPVFFTIDQQKKVLDPLGKRAKEIGAYVLATMADAKFLRDIRDIMQDMGIEINDFIFEPLGQALMLIPPEERDKRAILIDIGYLVTDVSVIEGDGVLFYAGIPMGGAHITSDTAIGLRVPFEQAEQLKRQYVFGLDTSSASEGSQLDMVVNNGEQSNRIPLQDVQTIIEARVEEIVLAIKHSLEKSGLHTQAKGGVYLSGGGISMMRGAREFVSNILDMPVKVVTPRIAGLNNPSFSGSLGVLDYALENPRTGSKKGILSVIHNIKKRLIDFF